MTHDYKRHGTTTLFAALNVLDVTVIGSCKKRDRHEEFLSFLKEIDFPWYDGHGNMIATLARSGSGYSLGNQRSYDPWGNVRQGQTSGDPKNRYCANLGHQQDDESSLIYVRARYYEPSSCRFLSEDPGKQGDNWYAYCGGNPVSRTDETGKEWLDANSAYGSGAAIAMALWFFWQYVGEDTTSFARGLKYIFSTVVASLGAYMAGNTASPVYRTTRAISSWAKSAANLPFSSTQIALIAGYGLALMTVCDDLNRWMNS